MSTFKRLFSHPCLLATLAVAALSASFAVPTWAQTPAPPTAQTPDAPPAPSSMTPGSTPGTEDSPAPTSPPVTTAPATPSAPASPTPPPDTVPAEHKRPHIGIGLDLGLFAPTSSHTRNRFGNSWFSLGLGIGNVRAASVKGRFSFELSTLYKSTGDHHAFIAPVGVEYRRALGAPGASVPYVGLSGDLVLADLRSPEDNVHSGFRTSGGGSVFLGTTFSERGYVEARYLFISKIKGFDLSGLNLTAGIRF